MAAAKNPNSRFVYSADAVAVAAVITSATSIKQQAWASAALPSIGGGASSSASSSDIGPEWAGILSFSSANTEITGKQTTAAGETETQVKTSVENPEILGGVLKATRVEVTETVTFNPGTKSPSSVTATASYDGLEIDGVSYADVTLDTDLANKVGKDHANRIALLHAKRGTPPNEKFNIVKGKAHTTLANNHPKLASTKTEHGFVDLKDNKGRVYFAEWTEEEDRQSTIGLRVKLTGTVKGEIVLADPGWNGGFYP